MPQKITTSSKSLVDAAKREIEEISAADAVKLAGRDDVVLVDIRDPRELERDGKVPGAFHMTRGMLEFWIDPESVYFKPIFGEDKKFVFFCAGGMRSALATKTAQDMGLKPVAHILGGFKAWKEAGGPVEPGKGRSKASGRLEPSRSASAQTPTAIPCHHADAERLEGHEHVVGRWSEAQHNAALSDSRHAYFIARRDGQRSASPFCATGQRRSRVTLVKRHRRGTRPATVSAERCSRRWSIW